MGKCSGGRHSSGCGHGGGRGYGDGGYRSMQRARYYVEKWEKLNADPAYQASMAALQANLAKMEAEGKAVRSGLPYGGHPLQQERPELQYQTVQVDNAAEAAWLNIAQRYQTAHERAEAWAHWLEGARGEHIP